MVRVWTCVSELMRYKITCMVLWVSATDVIYVVRVRARIPQQPNHTDMPHYQHVFSVRFE
jgi:hypothetical protein